MPHAATLSSQTSRKADKPLYALAKFLFSSQAAAGFESRVALGRSAHGHVGGRPPSNVLRSPAPPKLYADVGPTSPELQVGGRIASRPTSSIHTANISRREVAASVVTAALALASASPKLARAEDQIPADKSEINDTLLKFEPRGITPQDTIVFGLGVTPFAWATVEFWRRIVNGESFGTGKDSVTIDPETYEALIKDGADEDQLRRAGGRRVLGADAMFAARVLFAAAGLSLALVAYAVVQVLIGA